MKLAIVSLGGPGAKMIAREARKKFTKVDLIDTKEIEVHIGKKGMEVLYKQKPLKDYHCIYTRGSFKYALLQRSLTEAIGKKSYLPIKANSYTIGHDKFLTSIALKKNNIPTPGTYLALTTKSAKALLKEVNYPIIIKLPAGTHGKGVMFADTASSGNTILDTLEVFKQPFVIQEYIETGKGKAEDLRVIVAGNKILGAMKRKSGDGGELRANIHMGGKGEKVVLSYEQEQISIKAGEALGVDLCAVDILESGGESYVLEVNLSPGLKGITEATKKNVAKEVANFLHDQTKEYFKSKKEADVKEIIDSLDAGKNEILTNAQIKAERIILPEVITKVSGIKPDEEISISADNGKIIIKSTGNGKSKED
jgi:ribosomal protein S6--L-glutamate ligase